MKKEDKNVTLLQYQYKMGGLHEGTNIKTNLKLAKE